MPPTSAFAVTAHWDSRQVKTLLAALEPRQWAFATALTLTRVAQRVRATEVDAMKRDFDRPTPFTLNSLYLTAATRQQPEARVWFKDPPRLSEMQHYLLPEVYGGDRRFKRFESTLMRAGRLPRGRALVPASGAPSDAYGNVQRNIYARVYADLQASPIGANRRDVRGRSRADARSGRDRRYFYGNPGGKGRGIWQRFSFAFGNTVRPVFLETAPPTYRERFQFFVIGERTAETYFGQEFDKAAAETLRTAR